jgi:hypothetical protein
MGLMGSMAYLLVLLNLPPNPTSLAGCASMRGAMAQIVAGYSCLRSWRRIAGLLAIAVNRAFHDAGWALGNRHPTIRADFTQ